VPTLVVMATIRRLPNHRSGTAAPLVRAVLFDMDGTLVETEQYWGEAMFELAGILGGRMSESARAATVGSTIRRSMSILHADLGLDRTEEQLLADARWVEDRTAQLLATGISWCPGARELLTEVRAAGLRTALVTTTPRRLADIVLATIRTDLDGDPFDVTVCGDEVPARKPDPAPYRQAMAELGVQSGVAAGLAAGIAVLGVPTVQKIEPAEGLTLRDGLVGVDVPMLADVRAGRGLADGAA
jgi:beta-phosphoglucomutase-like phosphatase (HAD superfamily)